MSLAKVSKEDHYKLLIKQISELLNKDDPIITNLANTVAAIKESFSKVSWVGFYFVRGKQLFLGPFQGKVACTKIEFGKGVCGTSAESKKTILVENVHKFPGHIACDIESNSEIVTPIYYGNKVIAILDLDSKDLSTFDEVDQIWIEKISQLISVKLDLANNIIF